MSDHDQQSVRQRFNRRFVFGLHAVISGLISVVMFYLALMDPRNTYVLSSRVLWAGYARPDLIYAAAVLLGLLGLHGLWLLRREGRISRRRLGFAFHALLAAMGAAVSVGYLNSWYFVERYREISYYVPASPGLPPEAVITGVSLLAVLVWVTLPIHGIWLLYHELLARSLRRAEAKPKREQDTPMIGDDGELSDWVVEETKAKQSS